jgi:hypothetical protein
VVEIIFHSNKHLTVSNIGGFKCLCLLYAIYVEVENWIVKIIQMKFEACKQLALSSECDQIQCTHIYL